MIQKRRNKAIVLKFCFRVLRDRIAASNLHLNRETRSTLSTMLHVSTCFSTFSAFSFNECTLRYHSMHY